MIDVFTRLWDSLDQLGPAWSEAILRRADNPNSIPDASPGAFDENARMVQTSIVHGLTSHLLQAFVPANRVADYVALAPDKRIGFAGIDPTAPDLGEAVDEARALGLKGVTVSPAGQGFIPTDPRALKLYDVCVRNRWPVYVESSLVAVGPAVMEAGPPHLWDEVARLFPDLHIVIGTMGGPWINETLTLIAKHPRVFADMAHVTDKPQHLETVLVLAREQHAIDKILFASGQPFQSPADASTAILSLRHIPGRTDYAVARLEREQIVERDSLKLLGLR